MYLVRRVEPADVSAVYACRLLSLKTDPDAYLITYEEEASAGPARFERFLAERGNQAIFAAHEQNHPEVLVGMVGVCRESKQKLQHKAVLWGMFVDASVRRQGLGARLLRAAIAFAKNELSVQQLYLSAEATHYDAIRLYESNGFVAWGREPKATMDGSRCMDEVHYWLDLR